MLVAALTRANPCSPQYIKVRRHIALVSKFTADTRALNNGRVGKNMEARLYFRNLVIWHGKTFLKKDCHQLPTS